METMDRNEMKRQRYRVKLFDKLSYVNYGIAGAFSIWSAVEWIDF